MGHVEWGTFARIRAVGSMARSPPHPTPCLRATHKLRQRNNQIPCRWTCLKTLKAGERLLRSGLGGGLKVKDGG